MVSAHLVHALVGIFDCSLRGPESGQRTASRRPPHQVSARPGAPL